MVLFGADAPAVARSVIASAAGKVTLDGQMTETAWQSAALLGPFVDNDTGHGAVERTVVRACYDAEALYLGWQVFDRDIQATLTARDSRFWEEEVVEFFLAIDELEEYFELQWNPLGGVFDAIIHNPLDDKGRSKGIKGNWDYTAPGMRSQVRVRGTVADDSDADTLWTVEVRIPFRDLGVGTPKPGTQWRANFYRFNRGGGRPVEKQAWNPTRDPSFHQPSQFGVIVFR